MLRTALSLKGRQTNQNNYRQIRQIPSQYHTIAKSINKPRLFNLQFTKPQYSIFSLSRRPFCAVSEAQQPRSEESEEKFKKITFDDWKPMLAKATELEAQAKAFINKQNYEEAENLIYSVIYIRKSHIDSTGGLMSELAQDYLLLAFTQQNLQKNSLAEINYRLGIKLLEDKHKQTPLSKGERWSVLLQRMNYANLLAARYNFFDAIKQVKRVLTIIEKEQLRGPEYEEKYATILNNLAAFTSSTGDANEARNITEIALDLLEKSVGVNNLLYEGTFETYLQILNDLELPQETIQEKCDELAAKQAAKVDIVNGEKLSDIKPTKEIVNLVESAWKQDLNYYPCDPDGFISPPAILKAQIEKYNGSENPSLFEKICNDEQSSITKLLDSVEATLNRKRVVDPIGRYRSFIDSIPDDDVDTTPIDKYQRILDESNFPDIVGVEYFVGEQEFPNETTISEENAVEKTIDTTHLKNAEIDFEGDGEEKAPEEMEDDLEKVNDEDDEFEGKDLRNLNLDEIKQDYETLKTILQNYKGINPKDYADATKLLNILKRQTMDDLTGKSRIDLSELDDMVEKITPDVNNPHVFEEDEIDDEDLDDPEFNAIFEEEGETQELKSSEISNALKDLPDIEERGAVSNKDIQNAKTIQELQKLEDTIREQNRSINALLHRAKFALNGVEYDPKSEVAANITDELIFAAQDVKQIREIEAALGKEPQLLGDQKTLSDNVFDLPQFENNYVQDEDLKKLQQEKFLAALYRVRELPSDVLLGEFSERDFKFGKDFEYQEELSVDSALNYFIEAGLLDRSMVTPEFYAAVTAPGDPNELDSKTKKQLQSIIKYLELNAPFGNQKLMEEIEKNLEELNQPNIATPRIRTASGEKSLLNQEMNDRLIDEELIADVPRELENAIDEYLYSETIQRSAETLAAIQDTEDDNNNDKK